MTRTTTKTVSAPRVAARKTSPVVVFVDGAPAPTVLLDDLWLLSVADVATRLSLSPDMVYLLVKRGALQAVNQGADMRVSVAALRAYFASLPAHQATAKKPATLSLTSMPLA